MRHVQTIVTPTGPLSVITPVAETLLANGVISGTRISSGSRTCSGRWRISSCVRADRRVSSGS